MKKISYDKIKLGGFWKERFDLNKNATIPMTYNRFCDTGRFDAFRCDWKEGMENKPHFFWDSDVAKLLEAIAYTIKISPDKELEKIVDDTVDQIEKNQFEDGYFNIYYTVVEPGNRFTKRDNHELYCAGHLIEAAVAYYEATGKDKFLKVMLKYAELIERVFMIEKSAGFSTPGHEEIELALIRLYNCTGDVRWLELSRHFLEQRGRCENDKNCRNWCPDSYDQTDVPIRELPEAFGHSVRACYLYAGMADLARETNDSSLFDACEKLFTNISQKRMYITGGVGSSAHGEAFTCDYDLPNDQAYSETCASIALAMFAHRMSLISPNTKYDDIVEQATLNCILSGVSLDGKSFFYVNPLEINMERHHNNTVFRKSNEHLLTQRIEVFGCSCCPPNLARFVASIGNYAYSVDDNTIYVHQYIDNEAEFDGISIKQCTSYPFEGNIKFEIKNGSGKKIAVRIPSWCNEFKISGTTNTVPESNGYIYIDIVNDNFSFELDLSMDVHLVCANPEVDADDSKVALRRGPLVYCAERISNGNIPLNQYILDTDLKGSTEWDKENGYYTYTANAFIPKKSSTLYYRYTGDTQNTTLKFIPYYAFANNGESDMLIWFNHN